MSPQFVVATYYLHAKVQISKFQILRIPRLAGVYIGFAHKVSTNGYESVQLNSIACIFFSKVHNRKGY